MAISNELDAHLQTGVTTLARCWKVTRRDGVTFGFSDHDLDLTFDGVTYKADTGMTASALNQTTGLSIDNTEALGVLRSASIKEEDVRAGRYDHAKVEAWLVNWNEPSQRYLRFRGTVGELSREGGAFRAELNGLTEALNQPQGRAFQMPCSAVLGDGQCRFNLDQDGYRAVTSVVGNDDETTFYFTGLGDYPERWFERGVFTVLSGNAKDLAGLVKNDRLLDDGRREIELWEALRAEMNPGDQVRLEAGCDRLAATCRVKFNNFLNFRGFPDIPGEDWLMSYPVSSGQNDGGDLKATKDIDDLIVNPFNPSAGV